MLEEEAEAEVYMLFVKCTYKCKLCISIVSRQVFNNYGGHSTSRQQIFRRLQLQKRCRLSAKISMLINLPLYEPSTTEQTCC